VPEENEIMRWTFVKQEETEEIKRMPDTVVLCPKFVILPTEPDAALQGKRRQPFFFYGKFTELKVQE